MSSNIKSKRRPEKIGSKKKMPDRVQNAVNLFYATAAIGIFKLLIFPSANIRWNIVTISVALSSLAVPVFLAFMASRRHNWAKIALLILFIIGVPLSLPVILQEFSTNIFAGLISVIQVVFQVIAMVLFFQKPSNLWFKHK